MLQHWSPPARRHAARRANQAASSEARQSEQSGEIRRRGGKPVALKAPPSKPAGTRLLDPLRAQNESFLGHDGARPSDRRVGGDLVHEVIVVTRVVMEDYQGLYPRRIGKAHPLLPSRTWR